MAMSRERAERIVAAVLRNLKDRGGIGDALDAVDDDVWEEMAESLADVVQEAAGA